MIELMFMFDMRSTPHIGVPHAKLYETMLDMCEHMDRVRSIGFTVMLGEHHYSEDGYLPSPIVLASGCLGRTRHAKVRIHVLLPLYDPIRLAEDLAVLDLVGRGRIEIVLLGGYRREEYDMMGVDLSERGARMEEFTEVLKQAWEGEPFEFRGRKALVQPRPFQRPRPTIEMGGSSVVAARRAARLADAFTPTTPELIFEYRDALIDLGKDPGPETSPEDRPDQAQMLAGQDELLVAVSEDVDATWEQVGPFCLAETNAYRQWIATGAGAIVDRFHEVEDVDAIRSDGVYRVLTPNECIDWIKARRGRAKLQPLTGGLPTSVAWETVRLLEHEVLPAL